MTVAIIIALALICFFAIRSYIRKLTHGCCGTGSAGSAGSAGCDNKRRLRNADLSGYTHRYSVKIGGMTCKNCALRIENAFNRQEGLAARVDFKTGLAEVASNSQIAELTLRKTIVELGYSVEEIADIKP